MIYNELDKIKNEWINKALLHIEEKENVKISKNYFNMESIDDYGEWLVINRIYDGMSGLTDNELKNNGINIMKNIISERHFCDITIQKWSIEYGRKILDPNFDKLDVKTYPRYNNWNITGINFPNWMEYKEVNNMIILWVDYISGSIYGNYIYKLQELINTKYGINRDGGHMVYKNFKINEYKYKGDGKINWFVEDMLSFNDIFKFKTDKSLLTSEEINILKELKGIGIHQLKK